MRGTHGGVRGPLTLVSSLDVLVACGILGEHKPGDSNLSALTEESKVSKFLFSLDIGETGCFSGSREFHFTRLVLTTMSSPVIGCCSRALFSAPRGEQIRNTLIVHRYSVYQHRKHYCVFPSHSVAEKTKAPHEYACFLLLSVIELDRCPGILLRSRFQ